MLPRMLVGPTPSLIAVLLLASCTSHQINDERLPLGDHTFQSSSSAEQCAKPKHEHRYLERCVSLGGGGSQIPIRDVPGSVSIINRNLLDDQKTLRIEDALRNVSGVH